MNKIEVLAIFLAAKSETIVQKTSDTYELKDDLYLILSDKEVTQLAETMRIESSARGLSMDEIMSEAKSDPKKIKRLIVTNGMYGRGHVIYKLPKLK